MTDVLGTILNKSSELVKLLGDYQESFVGYVYGMRFDHTLVLTNDEWKHKVQGLPHNSFLVAAGFDPKNIGQAELIDQEVVLLRVLEPASLPQDGDLLRASLEHHQRRTDNEMFPGDANDGLDPMTHAELQYGGLRCRILGTFYEEGGKLHLGSDIENFMSLSRLRAYKPTGEALKMIVNHINPDVRKRNEEDAKKAKFKGQPVPIDLGTVRYTSTARMHRRDKNQLVTVQIQPTDFLARRTAVLGMTRTGKSNTVKTTVSAVAIAAKQVGLPVGQLIFDINGEYANATHQDDDSSIADVFAADTVRYRAIDTPGFEDLRTNFYEECNQALGLIQSLFKTDDSPYSGQDLDTFMESTLEEPHSSARGEHTRWLRLRAVFQCLLYKATYTAPTGFKVLVPLGKDLIKQVKDWAKNQPENPDIKIPATPHVSLNEAADWFETLRMVNVALKKEQRKARNLAMGIEDGDDDFALLDELEQAEQEEDEINEDLQEETKKEANSPVLGLKSSSKGRSWVDPVLEAYLNMLSQQNSREQPIGGYRAIQKYTAYHSPRRSADVTEEILKHLDAGKIVILDLSAGPVQIRQVLSKRIAARIFERQMATMNEGKLPQNLVLYVEEAHNLIGKKADLTDTWPRLAKEGAKAKIAFVYATQEPSSVHPNILANTENWFVTHLNNDDELRTLAKFYDFADFTSSLKAAQDVGFARIKTLSSPFVIPTQINRFTPEDIKKQLSALVIPVAQSPSA